MNSTHVDVLIVGAGISGVGAAYHLQKHCPSRTYAVIEAREAVGGTWDLFRYPGIRSDSDMYTFGYKFKPWVSSKAISPGEFIRRYIRDAAEENGIYQRIEFSSRARRTNWDSRTATWTTQIEDAKTGDIREIVSRFFFCCSGYYSYAQGYLPEFTGSDTFSGQIIHPQHWPEDTDYAQKNVVVIGSGATAVTLVPTLATSAKHVTMLQRSPTYIVARPGMDKIASFLQSLLPSGIAYALIRWKNILGGMFLYWFSRTFPARVKKAIVDDARKALGPEFDVETHFTPAYDPWDQRICLVPDGDFFEAIRAGTVSIVTDQIQQFTPRGISLRSGEHLDADIIVTATGLNIEVFGGMTISVNGTTINPASTHCYKGMMLSGLPNMAFSIGYTNASWTLKSDLVGEYVCRLINHMDKHGYDYCVPETPPEGIEEVPLMDFTSGYVVRSQDKMPTQGTKSPWKLYQNYIFDRITLGLGTVTDSSMSFVRIPTDQPGCQSDSQA